MSKQTPLEFARELVEKHHDVYQLESLAVEHALLTVDYLLLATWVKSPFYQKVKQILHNPLTEYDDE